MKHYLPFVLCILLAGCALQQKNMEELPPEQVLAKAALAAQKLESSQYLITADFSVDSGSSWTAKGILRMDGIMQDAGDKMRLQSDLSVDVDDVQGDYSLEGVIETVVMNEQEMYLKVHSLTSQPDNSFFNPATIARLTGTWWVLPPDDTAPQVVSVTPDPSLLQAQARVVRVTENHGVEDGKYHYSVELDKAKLLAYLSEVAKESGRTLSQRDIESAFGEAQASGEIWIDTETFLLQKIEWDISSLRYDEFGSADVSLTVTFRNQDAAPVITAPTEATLFTPAVLYTLPEDALLPDELPTNDALDDILQNFPVIEE